MRSIFLLILFHLLLTPVFADSSLQSARHARALLGADTWSRVIEIENTNRHSVYPRKLYALIFEFSGILWFYTETDGTQSFSLWSNRLELEKADFREGLRQIDPGFIQYSAVEDKDALPLQSGKLPNGCWIESFVAGRKQIAQDQSIREARLVMYYADDRLAGHCVLAYETRRGVFVLDPTRDNQPHRISDHWPRDLMQIARAAWPQGGRTRIKEARALDFPLQSGRLGDRTVLASRSSVAGEHDSPALRKPDRG